YDTVVHTLIYNSIYFISSRRRHTISKRDWSSDVCSSDLIDEEHRESIVNKTAISAKTNRSIGARAPSHYLDLIERNAQISASQRSEERRVGKRVIQGGGSIAERKIKS